MNTLFGKKVQQTQAFLENGTRIPVTVVAASSNVIMGLKTADRDSYNAVQVGFGKTKKSTKALLGSAKKANLDFVPQMMREVRVDDTAPVELGKVVSVDEVFKPGDIVDVTGISKGKGFAGGVKRYHFKGGPRTHGQSDRERAPGSIGQTTTPGRVYRGKRMAGNMGRDTVTVKNLLIIDIDPQTGRLFIKGLVPGILGSVIEVTKVGEVKEKNFVPLFKVAEPVVEEPSEPEAQEVREVITEEAKVEESAQPASEEPSVETAPETEAAPVETVTEEAKNNVKEDAK